MSRLGVEHKTQARVGSASLAVPIGLGVTVLGLLNVCFQRVKRWFETPSRPYGASSSVGEEYDNWTREGVLEHYWGEHIHMGSYTPMGDQKGYNVNDPFLVSLLRATLFRFKNFKDAKIDFTNEMIAFSKSKLPEKILDVGCGIGGTSRMLARKFPNSEITGITLSPEQVERATALAKEAGLSNIRFTVMNALEMTFPENTFDLVWGCESGEHMPNKKKYIEEMVRVLKPGGRLAVATWCERDPTPPFSNEERKALDFVYREWVHPYFISLNKYKEHLLGTGALAEVETEDWTQRTLPSWRHSIWVGVWSPFYWLKISFRHPRSFLMFLREVFTLEQYHQGMRRGLLVYGMMRAMKK